MYAQVSVSVRDEKTEDIQALDWFPDPVVFRL